MPNFIRGGMKLKVPRVLSDVQFYIVNNIQGDTRCKTASISMHDVIINLVDR
ncbi:hypothetical protein BGM26_00720 [Bacillus sp. FJAT-29790]|uniref:hypothetical protein n=1 Tax=Bacillus sp. FJAT-29790 TaxID=1895002 RepID=UPI001C245C3A|nr:hypothetical protein [Bacillus sp. FJAT-29790]MBU8877509.1 hypothetical protein [Bacillus sp. FJAT-29790]